MLFRQLLLLLLILLSRLPLLLWSAVAALAHCDALQVPAQLLSVAV
jgi:hypothetical protein